MNVIGCEHVDWIYVAQGVVHWRALVITAVNHRVTLKAEGVSLHIDRLLASQ
jgi:hypothetical protein